MVLFNIGPETPTTEYRLFDSVGKPRQKPTSVSSVESGLRQVLATTNSAGECEIRFRFACKTLELSVKAKVREAWGGH